jgi:hypothetical protein
LSPVAYRYRGDRQPLQPVDFLPFGQPRGLFLILLPNVAEPLGPGALSGVENRPDEGQTSVDMKRDWTSTKGVHQLNSGPWSVPLIERTNTAARTRRDRAGASALLTQTL